MSRINSSAKGTYQDMGNDEHYDFVTYQGEPLKAGRREGMSYMGAMEDTVNAVQPPLHNLNSEADDDHHGHSSRELTPG